jgi:hypothetical protein
MTGVRPMPRLCPACVSGPQFRRWVLGVGGKGFVARHAGHKLSPDLLGETVSAMASQSDRCSPAFLLRKYLELSAVRSTLWRGILWLETGAICLGIFVTPVHKQTHPHFGSWGHHRSTQEGANTESRLNNQVFACGIISYPFLDY